MADIESMTKDTRPIDTAWSDVPDGAGATVGFDGTTRIIPYTENGQGAAVPWLAVYKGDFLWKRLNVANMAEIVYAEETPTDG